MISVKAAIEAAEARKVAMFGDPQNGGAEIVVGDDHQGRALLSGFDIDYDELTEIRGRVGPYFAAMAGEVGLRHLFDACWTDAFLIGMLAASLPPPTGSDTLPSDPEGG